MNFFQRSSLVFDSVSSFVRLAMFVRSVFVLLILVVGGLFGAPDISSRHTSNGLHTRFDYSVDPDPSMPARCLFVWHRLPPYLYVEPEQLREFNATILGEIDVEASTSQSHPFAYCFILYNSTRIPFRETKIFTLHLHSRYLEARDDQRSDETLFLPEPVIHFTEAPCPKLGSGCPAPLMETGIESPRELTVTIPFGQRKHLWFVTPITYLFASLGCSLIFIFTGRTSSPCQ